MTENRFGFRLDDELTEELLEVVEQLRSDARSKAHVAHLVDTVLKLTDVGLREYYVRPLEQAKAGVIALGTAKVGISTAKKGISVVVGKVLKGMSEKQLQSIADSIEDLLIRRSGDPDEAPIGEDEGS